MNTGVGGPLDALTDEQLVALIQQGNINAFNNLSQRWETSLYRFIRRMMGNSEDARDVCQEAWAKAYQNIGTLREGAKFRAWIHYIALNLCRDRFRSLKSKAIHSSYEEGGLEVLPEGHGKTAQWATTRHVEQTSLKTLLDEALTALPNEQRTAIVLREYQGFTSEEIAEITGVPAATVRSRIFYGFKALRRILGERGISPEQSS